MLAPYISGLVRTFCPFLQFSRLEITGDGNWRTAQSPVLQFSSPLIGLGTGVEWRSSKDWRPQKLEKG